MKTATLPKHMMVTGPQRQRQSMIARKLIKVKKQMSRIMPMVYVSTSTSTSTITSNSVWVSNSGTWGSPTGSTIPVWIPSGTDAVVYEDRPVPYTPSNEEWKVGKEMSVTLPDGTMLQMSKDGNFKIIDAKAKVTYKSNSVRDFNSYINASDKLEDFIRFCGEVGVRQGEMLEIPIKHFIGWLIVKAAEADGEEPPALPDLRPKLSRCLHCGRFMAKRHVERKIFYCRSTCLEKEMTDAGA